ncbi:EAL domain-containing protein [Peribacillus sp. SCS-155]|uniref:sensor domain-containing protein n=1 Tax=Peribacillus sedimenti TaxID=3115297 RepID=UPI003905EE02
MFVINIFFLAAAIVFSIAASYLFLNDRMDAASSGSESVLKRSIKVGASFFISHVFVTLSFHYQYSEKAAIYYAIFHALIFGMYCYLSLQLIGKRGMLPGSYFPALIVSLCLVIGSAEFAGAYYLFQNDSDVKLYQVILNYILIAAVSMASLRYFSQFRIEAKNRITHLWRLSGSAVIGISIASLPYLMILSVADVDSLFFNDSEVVIFIPYCIQLLILSCLFLLPDLLREKQFFEQEKRYEEQQHNHDALFKHHPNPVFLLDEDGRFLSANQECTSFTLLQENELIHKHIYDFIIPNDVHSAQSAFNDTLKGNANTFELTLKNTNGNRHEVRITSIPMWCNEKVKGVYGIVQDITEAKTVQDKITYLAYHDEMTGLYTRRALLEKLSELEAEFSVLYLDLDRFKELNDLFGHSFGDEILVEAVARISSCLPSDSVYARLGGDEFAILLPGIDDTIQIESLADRIVEQIRQPFSVGKNEYYITASLGGAMYPVHGTDKEQIIKYADTAMYSAKKSGKNNFKMFSEEIAEVSKRKFMLGNELRKAIGNKEFEVHYQPKITLDTGHLSGAEALVRWNHPARGMVAPFEFIPVAEENGLIIEIENIVFEKVCSQLQEWTKESKQIPVAINLSQKHFYQEDIVEKFQEHMDRYEIPPHLLEIEITESIMFDQNPAIISRLHALRDMGIKISIDDFGTGYSSLSYIKRLPIDKVKIDKSFIMDLSNNEDSKAIVSLILSMANHLNLEVVAEGIEDEQQLTYLQSMKCLEGQGYLFSKPLPTNDFKKFLLQAG